MLCSDTGEMEIIHLPDLHVDLARDINDSIAAVKKSPSSSGSVFLSILPGGFVQVIERTLRKIRKKPVIN